MLNTKSPKYWAFKNPGYSWLSLSQIFDISNFALSGIIYPVQYLAFDQSKKISQYLESRYLEFLPMSNKLSGFLSSFFSLSQIFPKISKTFCNFSSQISQIVFFSTPARTITATVPARMSEESLVEFFLSFFDRMFWFDFLIPRIFYY